MRRFALQDIVKLKCKPNADRTHYLAEIIHICPDWLKSGVPHPEYKVMILSEDGKYTGEVMWWIDEDDIDSFVNDDSLTHLPASKRVTKSEDYSL